MIIYYIIRDGCAGECSYNNSIDVDSVDIITGDCILDCNVD